jgi:hypothetical protein
MNNETIKSEISIKTRVNFKAKVNLKKKYNIIINMLLKNYFRSLFVFNLNIYSYFDTKLHYKTKYSFLPFTSLDLNKKHKYMIYYTT